MDLEQVKTAAVECFVRAMNESDISVVRLLVAEGETLLEEVSAAEGRTVRAGDLATVEQLLAFAQPVQQARSAALPSRARRV